MNLKELRTKKGWSQQTLSDKSGVPKRTIEHIEATNSTTAKLDTCIALADALEVSLDELCSNKTE